MVEKEKKAKATTPSGNKPMNAASNSAVSLQPARHQPGEQLLPGLLALARREIEGEQPLLAVGRDPEGCTVVHDCPSAQRTPHLL